MMRLLLYVIFNVFCLCIINAEEMLNYKELVNRKTKDLYNTAESYMYDNCADTAIGYYIVIVGQYSDSMLRTDKYLCALSCSSAGLIYSEKANYSQAFEMYMKGINICEDNNFNDLLPVLYKNIGNIYSVFNDETVAVNCYEKGLKYSRMVKDTVTEIKLIINLSGISCFNNDPEKAKKYYDEMIAYEDRDSIISYFKYFNKALIICFENRFGEAVELLKQAAAYAEIKNLPPQYEATAYGELAKVFEKMDRQDSTLYYLQKSSKFCEKKNLAYVQLENLKLIYQLYEKCGEWKSADEYRLKYLYLSDSLFDKAEFDKRKNSQIFYELSKNYNEISRLTQDKEAKDAKLYRQKIVIFASISCLLVFAVMLVIMHKQKKKLYTAYKALFYRNDEMLRSEQKNKEIRDEYEHRISILTTDLKNIREQLRNDNCGENIQEEINRVVINRISEEHKNVLLESINNIMENTKDFCDMDFSLDRLADMVGSNSKYVSLVINEVYQKNFRTFVNEYRINEAKIRLSDTINYGHYTIKAIGESVGYKSQANFTELFKKATGITPYMYQKIALDEKERTSDN